MLADRGFSDELGKAGCAKAKELLGNGFFPGAAIAGGLAYAEGLDSGLSHDLPRFLTIFRDLQWSPMTSRDLP